MSAIQYFVLVPDSEDQATFFQGYNSSILSNKFANLLYTACHLPHHIEEIFFKQKQLIAFRKNQTGKDIAVINCKLLIDFIDITEYQHTVILCLPSEIKLAQDFHSKAKLKPIILSFDSAENVINLRKSTGSLTHIIDYELYKTLKHITFAEAPIKVKENFRRKKLRPKYNKKLQNPSRAHGVTRPNETLIKSLGFVFNGEEKINALDNFFYREAILNTAKQIILLSEKEKSEIVIYCPSIYTLLYDVKQNLWNQILRKTDKWHRDFIKNLIRNPNFSNSIIKYNETKIETWNPYDDEVAGPILAIRQKELNLTSMAIAMLTTSESIPSIRLPNAVNLHAGLLKDIERLSDDIKEESQNLLKERFLEFDSKLNSEVGEEFVNFISKKSYACKICSDVPIEWGYFENVPLMFSHEISKIPMTPGNMLLQLCGLGANSVIKADELDKILIIRSFPKTDPLKNLLETSINSFLEKNPLDVQIKDVTTIDGVIAELNKFEGKIVIFDCHGTHDGKNGAGYLSIGNDRLNTWELAHKARIPPIIMLSACSTAAIAGSHASVANGLLRSGALSVIGTYVPVDGLKSSVFFARILFRISMFLKSIKSMGFKTVTWRTLISTFMRMSYITDVLTYLVKTEIITKEQYYLIHLESNFIINSLAPSWHQKIFDIIAMKTGKSSTSLMETIKKEYPLVETMFYTQIGRPELINIIL